MKIPAISMSPVKQEVIYLTGGLNESVASVQLKSGELWDCINYQEVDGPYSGYSSVAGYERFDGRVSPSSIDAQVYVDGGTDGATHLLLESQVDGDISDISMYQRSVTSTNVTNEAGFFKLSSSSFSFTPGASISTGNIDFNQDFCIDFTIRLPSILGSSVLFEESGVLKCSLVSGNIVVDVSTNGSTYDQQLVTTTVLGINQFIHVSVQLEGSLLFVNIFGALDSTPLTITGTIFTNTSDFIIGSSTFTGYIESFRVSTSRIRFPLPFTPPTRLYSTAGYREEYVDDEAREAQRALIGTVPGEGNLLGVVEYDGVVYAFRNAVGALTAEMYKSSPTGWVQVIQPVGKEFKINGDFEFFIYRFESFNSNLPVLAIVDGVSIPRLFDGTTITIQTSAELPDNAATPKYASKVGAYDNRLFYGYTEGSIVFSAVGAPTTFSSITTLAGELFLGSAITNIIEAPGNVLILFLRDFIKILKGVSYDGTNPWAFQVETFSRSAGAISKSAKSFMGDVYFADTEGVSSLTTVSAFGDFSAATISKKVQKTFLAKSSLISGALVDRRTNQYKLYFSDGTSLYFSFNQEKKVKGATKIVYPISIYHLTQSEDGLDKYFTSSGGYVYKMDSGTSSDGDPIITYLLTSFYHYKTPRIWKHFRKITAEFSMGSGVKVDVRTLFDFQEASFPRTSLQQYVANGVGGVWGYSNWGDFTWGVSTVQKGSLYLRGYGTNMAVELRTISKYKAPHVINNFIVDYSLGNRQV